MKFLTSLLMSFLLVAAPITFTGCTSAKGVKTASYIGTSLALSEHPEWRPAFELAYADLGVIEAAETIGMAEVLAILHRLPIKELRSPEARIIITATALLVEDFGSFEVNAVTTEKLRPTVKQLRAGIRLALDTSFADYDADGTLKLAARTRP